MVKKRLIACLLWRSGMLIQSKQFSHTNAVGNAYTAIDFFNTWAIDEIILLDVTRKKDTRDRFHADLVELSSRCFVPLAVGGWVETLDDIHQLLHEGADKVVINTGAIRDISFIAQAAKRFGKQCIVVSIDAKKLADGTYTVIGDRGRVPSTYTVDQWARQVEEAGAGEIFLTSIDCDGMKQGYDTDLVALVSKSVGIPVIASGGVGEWQHFMDGFAAGADAVSAANIFHYMEQSTKKAKNYLFEQGIDVRQPAFYDVSVPRKVRYRV